MGIPLCCMSERKDIPIINNNSKIKKHLQLKVNNDRFTNSIIKIQSHIRVYLAKNKLINIFDSIKSKITKELEQKKLINEIIIIESESHKYYKKYTTEKRFPFYEQLKHKNKELSTLVSKLSKYSFVIPYYIVTSPNEVYKGSWNINKRYNGYGVKYEFNDDKTTNKRIEGIFINGCLFGEGKVVFSNGELMIGNFVRNNLNGNGEHYRRDHSIYKGEFKNGKYNGNGREFFQDSNFEGFFSDGHKSYGALIFKNGSKYQGEFLNDVFHGNGMYTWPNKNIYVGEWKEGKMNGKGKHIIQDKSYYEGEFVDGKKCGFGKYVWEKDKYYEGEWKNNKQNGQGTYHDKNKVIRGIWEDGKITSRITGRIKKNHTFMKQSLSRNETPIKKGATQEYLYKRNNFTEKKSNYHHLNFNPTAKGKIAKNYYRNYANLNKYNQNSMYSIGSQTSIKSNNNNYEDSKTSN